MKQIKAVLFDLDNTLIERGKALAKVADTLIRDYFPHRKDEYAAIKDAFCLCFVSGYVKNADCYQNFCETVHWEDAPSYETFFKYWSFYYPYFATLMPDAMDVLQRLKAAGYKIGIITNGPIGMQNAKIDVAGFRDILDLALVSAAYGVHKPDPSIFRYAAEQIGCDVDECLYIGDHPRNDIFGAKSAGMQTAWFRGYETWDDQYERADMEIDSLMELREQLGF